MSLIQIVNERMQLQSFYIINFKGKVTIVSAKISFVTELQNRLKYALRDNIQL